jgi:hypothetical protein
MWLSKYSGSLVKKLTEQINNNFSDLSYLADPEIETETLQEWKRKTYLEVNDIHGESD